MNLYKVKDNSSYKKDEFSSLSNLTKRIENKTLEKLQEENIFIFPELVKDSEDITKDQMILRSQNGFYCTNNLMVLLAVVMNV